MNANWSPARMAGPWQCLRGSDQTQVQVTCRKGSGHARHRNSAQHRAGQWTERLRLPQIHRLNTLVCGIREVGPLGGDALGGVPQGD